MKEQPYSLYWLSANVCVCLGFISVLSAYVAIADFKTLFELTKPIAITSFLLVFPFFITFVLLGFTSSIKGSGTTNHEQKKSGGFIKNSLNDLLEPIRILLNIPKVHITSCICLLISAVFIYNTHQIGGIHWAFGSAFEREHAISFGTTAAIFYAIMIPFYSLRSEKSAVFNSES